MLVSVTSTLKAMERNDQIQINENKNFLPEVHKILKQLKYINVQRKNYYNNFPYYKECQDSIIHDYYCKKNNTNNPCIHEDTRFIDNPRSKLEIIEENYNNFYTELEENMEKLDKYLESKLPIVSNIETCVNNILESKELFILYALDYLRIQDLPTVISLIKQYDQLFNQKLGLLTIQDYINDASECEQLKNDICLITNQLNRLESLDVKASYRLLESNLEMLEYIEDLFNKENNKINDKINLYLKDDDQEEDTTNDKINLCLKNDDQEEDTTNDKINLCLKNDDQEEDTTNDKINSCLKDDDQEEIKDIYDKN